MPELAAASVAGPLDGEKGVDRSIQPTSRLSYELFVVAEHVRRGHRRRRESLGGLAGRTCGHLVGLIELLLPASLLAAEGFDDAGEVFQRSVLSEVGVLADSQGEGVGLLLAR